MVYLNDDTDHVICLATETKEEASTSGSRVRRRTRYCSANLVIPSITLFPFAIFTVDTLFYPFSTRTFHHL